MSDRYDQDTILGYVEGELDDKQRESFESVIEQDHELRNLVSQMKLDRQALRSLGMKPAPIGMVDQVIQSQERAALLGEPEVPEPLPMVLPVSRHKLRRVLAYSGIAAVLLLSAALVIPTLMPSGLLDRQSQVAQLDTGADAPAAKRPRNGSGYALLDEDAAYDRAATRSLTRLDTESTHVAEAPAPQAAAANVEGTEATNVTIAEASPPPAHAVTKQAVTETKDRDKAPASPALVMAERAETPGPVSTAGDAAIQPKADALAAKATTNETATLTDTVKPEADAPAEKVELAKAAPIDPFTGYAGTDVRITDDTQILINTASPTLARRDLRDWAFANSARVEEQALTAGLGGARARAMTAPDRTLLPAPGAAGQPGTAGTAQDLDHAGAKAQLVVEIDQAKVPLLLAYLNRNADQRAELVAQADGLGAAPATARDSERARKRRAERLAREAERKETADQSTALTNRMVDTKSAWPNSSLATGLAPTQPDADKNRVKADRVEPKEETSPKPDETRQRGKAPDADVGTSAEVAPDAAAPKPFDWGNLLDTVTTKPAAPAPLLQPDPRQRVRLTVIIQQVPTGGPTESD